MIKSEKSDAVVTKDAEFLEEEEILYRFAASIATMADDVKQMMVKISDHNSSESVATFFNDI